MPTISNPRLFWLCQSCGWETPQVFKVTALEIKIMRVIKRLEREGENASAREIEKELDAKLDRRRREEGMIEFWGRTMQFCGRCSEPRERVAGNEQESGWKA